jgi:hypothetical protein
MVPIARMLAPSQAAPCPFDYNGGQFNENQGIIMKLSIFHMVDDYWKKG